MTSNLATLPQPAAVTVDGATVTIHDLTVEDAGLADLLTAHSPAEHADLVARVLAVGSRGLVTMGLGIDLASVDARIKATLSAAIDEAERRTAALLEAGEQAFSEHFDLERRSSVMARALQEFSVWRDGLLGSLDPSGADSHTTRFLQQLHEVLGPDGSLEHRLSEALDPEADGSGLSRLAGSIDGRFTELRDLIIHARGRDEGRGEEAARGTAQGVDFEDVVETLLRSEASGLGGCIVERVARDHGALGSRSTVGDFVVEFPDGGTMVVEAKNQARVGLKGADGILEELDRAMANRNAGFGVCVSQRDAFPAEVGCFGLYGDRLLVVDDGDGTMVRVAMRWARAALAARAAGGALQVDTAYLAERLERIRTMAERFKTAQRSLTEVGKSVDGVREALREMRTDLIDLVDDVRRELASPASA
ncbi:MAG: hypothetical protein KJ956_13630 [Actinobacteria bacterium]|nr:hypothetical protein [Actinomycetota bacterium]